MRGQYLKSETIISFFDCVKKMRLAQKYYYNAGGDDALNKAKKLEKITDQFIKDIELIESEN